MTTALDRMIPFDSRWVLIYVACFAYWAVSYVLMARQESWYPIMTGEVLAKLLCGVLFLLIPTTNVRPEITDSGFTAWLMGLIYQLDPPLDLFPSIHCMESWICFRGMLRQKKIPKWYQVFAGIFTVPVCLSTLFTRQHVIADVIVGVLLGGNLFGCIPASGLWQAAPSLDRSHRQKGIWITKEVRIFSVPLRFTLFIVRPQRKILQACPDPHVRR